MAGAAGVSAVASTLSGSLIAFAPDADAANGPSVPAAVTQDVFNDWGQTPAQVTEEINLVVDADARVITARTRYLHALSSYATLKKVQKVAWDATKSAKKTASKTDDVATARTYAAVTAKVFTAAREVVSAQLAMATIVNRVSTYVTNLHYVQAPYVAVPTAPTGVTTIAASGQITLTWAAVDGATGYQVYRDGLQVATTVAPTFIDTGLDNGISYSYTVLATNVAGWSSLSAAVTGTPAIVAPPVPTSLVASPGDATVTLAWAASANATSYQVFRNGTLAGTSTTTGFVDVGLADGTPYSYTVVALNGTVASAPSAAVSATPVATAPAAPTNLVATPGNNQVSLTWTAPTGATKYDVYRGATKLATVTSPTYLDSTALNNTTYTYTVVAYRLNSPASPASAAASAKPVAPPLSTPTNVAATPGNNTVTVTWTSVVGATSYQVYRTGGTAVGPQTVTTPSYTDNTAVNGTAYSYYVIAVGPQSSSAASATVSATPAAPAAGAPTGLSGTAGDTIATLTWNPVAGATSYKLYRNGVALSVTITGNTYTDSGLTNNATYSYYVTAINGTESAPSATISVTPFVLTPAAPTGLTATPGNAQVSLSWTASANATGYKVYRDGVLVSTQATTTYLSTGLTNGQTYAYYVVATNGSASSPSSATVSATPLAPAPAAPTGLVATAGNAKVVLTWTAVTNATSYKVYRGGVLLTTVTTPTYTDAAVTNGTAYTYYVTAVNTTTEGAASTTVTATPTKPPVNGTFTGKITSIASGHGTIQVVIVVTNSVITKSTGTLLTNDGTETVNINKTALPQYDTKAVAANSANITKVSGASLTWTAYKTSLQDALTQAGL